MITFNNLDEIIDNLWLGNSSASEDIKDLKDKGIKKVLTLLNIEGPKYKEEDGFIHKKIVILDFEKENIIKYFGECLNFIKGDDKVLVHCMAGASRSTTIVIAYLMWTKKMKYQEALDFVKKKDL